MIAEALFDELQDQNFLDERSERIIELNEEYPEEAKQAALDWTNAFIAEIKHQRDQAIAASVTKLLATAVSLDQVAADQQRVAQDSFTCGVCFQLLQDPVCCANESCNYMLCRAHLADDASMRCPNRCGADPLRTVKVQRVVLNQLMSLEVTCALCRKVFELGEREAHLAKYCDELVVERCAFADCKSFEACKRDQFEAHLREHCASKAKQCTTCSLDLFQMYEDDAFRTKVHGHLCHRDRLLFLWETLLEAQGDADEEEEKQEEADGGAAEEVTELGAGPARDRHYSAPDRKRLSSVRESLAIARECAFTDKIEFTDTTCQNGHQVEATDLQTDVRFANRNLAKCINCQRKIVDTKKKDAFVACAKKCKQIYCMDCMGCEKNHILCFARNKRNVNTNASIVAFRKCHRCKKDLTMVQCFLHCKADNFSYCIKRCVPF